MSSSNSDRTSYVADEDHGVVDGEAAAAPVNPLLQVHALLRGRYWIAITLAIVGMVAGGLAGYRIQKPVYTSTGMIHIKPYVRPLLPGQQSGTVPFFDSFLSSQVALLKSRRVIDLAMQQPDWKGLNRGIAPKQVQEFIENLEAVNPRGSELLIVSFTDEQPDVARRAVKSVIDAYELLANENDTMTTESQAQKLRTMQTGLLADQKRANDRIRALSGTMPSEEMKKLYAGKLEKLLDWQQQLHNMDIGIARAGGAAPPAKIEFKPFPAEFLAQNFEDVRDLLLKKDGIERQLEVDRGFGPRRTQQVFEAEAQLKALNAQIQRKVDSRNALLRDRAALAQNPQGKPLEQLQAERAAVQKEHDREKADMDDLGRKISEIDNLRAELKALEGKLQDVTTGLDEVQRKRLIEHINYLSRGDMPPAPSKDKRKAMAAAGSLGLGGAGVGLVLLLGLLDRRIRHIADVTTTAQSNRVLGVLPMLPSEDSGDPEQAMVAAHGVHQIRMLLQGRIQSRKNSVIAITSASAGAGKTSLTMALGLSFAASGARTLLIDCDIIGGGLTSKLKRVTRRRTGCILRRLGLITTEQMVGAVRTSRRRGERIGETLIRHGLVTRADVDHALQVQQESPVGLREALMGDPPNECITGGGSPNLFVMPLGSAQPQHVAQMSYPALQRLVSQVRGWFDVVLIDTGPILGSLEASVAAMVADDVVLAVAKGEHRPLIDRAIQHLGSVGGRLAGIVLNRANADDILASNFSSSASSNRQSNTAEQHGALKVRSGDHKCLQLGPIGRAVVAASDTEPPLPTAPFAPQGRPGDSTP